MTSTVRSAAIHVGGHGRGLESEGLGSSLFRSRQVAGLGELDEPRAQGVGAMRIGVQALMHAPWATEQVTTATGAPAPRVNVPAACSVTGCSPLCVALCALLLTRDEAEGTEADAVAGVAGRVAQTPGDGAGGDRRGEDGQGERDSGLHRGCCWVYVVLWFWARGS